MPTLRNTLPKYRKHRGTGQAVVTLSGRDHYLGKHGTAASRREYDRLIAEWLVSGRQELAGDSDLSIAELLTRYLKHAKAYYEKDGKQTSEVAGMKAAIRPLKELYARTNAADFGPLALKAVRQRLIEAGWARSTVNQAIGRIKRIFRWAVSEQLVPESVYAALATVEGLRRGKTAAAESKPIRPVEAAVVDATLPCLPEVAADMVRVQRAAGMRPSEVCIMRPCDIDRSGDVWLYVPQSHKTEHHGQRRVVCLGRQAQEVLLRYLARDPSDYCFQPRDSEAKRRAIQHQQRVTPLSCGDRPGTNRKRKPKRKPGNCYNSASYARAIHRACIKAKVEPWSPNRLRHAAATEVRKRFGLEAAQVYLGHSQAKVTEVYAERDMAKAIEVAREVG
ncbi:site-specific integrase [Aeoliella sp. ICT_H6.2]|uniref:Site-specific integrase n=1 Tax=Aeoliella straminimaris TaxID=2954799 RepID=A0A9X2FC97_9BACT|nr:site-specific integrase [Aeoliella straminimaris]MCO6043326.1 site-specific integrase [Aeoliella straminimaris]